MTRAYDEYGNIVDIVEWEKKIRSKAIDDFAQKVKEHQYVLSDVINSRDYGMFTIGIEQIAEELKEGRNNDA